MIPLLICFFFDDTSFDMSRCLVDVIFFPLNSGHRCINDIMQYTVAERLRQRDMVVHYVSKDGKKRFHGGSQLKASQSYPAMFIGLHLSTPFSKL